MGNIMHRARYQKLVIDENENFIQMILNKVRELDCVKTAENLLEKKAEIKQYLKDNKWSTTDKTAHQWNNPEEDSQYH